MPPKIILTPEQQALQVAAAKQAAENLRKIEEQNAAILSARNAPIATSTTQTQNTATPTVSKAEPSLPVEITLPGVPVATQADDKNVKCFQANLAKKNYVHYINQKLAFNSSLSSSNNSCLMDRPNGFIITKNTTANGFEVDGDCYDESGMNISNEPTHVLYNSNSKNRLINNDSCLSYGSDGTFGKVSQTATFDLASGWSYEDNMLITNRDRKKAIRVNGNNKLEIGDKDSNNLEFLWEKEGSEFRNIKTNKCLNIGEMGVSDCVGPVRHTRWDYVNNKLLKNRRTGRCLDSNGSSVYMGGCSADNPFQYWSIENNGSVIRHSSGKCLAQRENNYKTELYMVDCKCEGIVPGEESEQSYLNYVNNFAGGCNVNEWGYDKVGEACLFIATQNYNIMDKLISWCDKNQKNESVNKYCMEFMKYNDLLQYYSRFCSEENGVGEKPLCVKVAVDSDTLILDEKAREFIKIKWDNAMYKSCEKGMIFTKEDKDTNKFNWKYTTNDIDEECLSNWTFRDTKTTPPTDTIIQKTTSLGDNGYWCPTVNGKNDPRLNCGTHSKTLNYLLTETKYKGFDTAWKEEGAETDLPLRLYKKFVFRSNASLETWKTFIRSDFKINNDNKDTIHFAYFALFYGGFPIKVHKDTPFGVRYYSLNGKNYIFKESNYGGVKKARVTMTPKGPTGLEPGFDIIVAPYRDYFAMINGVKKKISNVDSNYYLFITDDGLVKGVKSNGEKVDITPISSFGNKDQNDLDNEENKSWSAMFIIFIIVIILSSMILFNRFIYAHTYDQEMKDEL